MKNSHESLAGNEAAAKVMYEIYREMAGDDPGETRYRVVYYSELTEGNKAREIDRALNGQHLYDGFIAEVGKVQAKAIIADFVEQLNQGADPDLEQLELRLADHAR